MALDSIIGGLFGEQTPGAQPRIAEPLHLEPRAVVRIRDARHLRALQRECFIEMPPLGLGTPAPCSVMTQAYDAQLTEHGRPDVRAVAFGDRLGDEARRISVVLPYHDPSWRERIARKRMGIAEHGALQEACAMFVEDAAELERHLGIIYQVSRLNYLDSKSCVPAFPEGYCLSSSSAVAEGLQLLGYINSFRAAARFRKFDHHYVSLPFIMRGGEWGLIGCDPTSDQLKSHGVKLPPNLMFVATSDELKYPISTRSSNGYFPDIVFMGHMDGAKEYSMKFDGVDYLAAAFQNPVKLTLSIDR